MLLEKADEQEVDLEILGPVNCRNYKSSYRLVSRLVNEFRDPDDELPKSGYSTDTVFEFLYEEIENVGGNVLVILDGSTTSRRTPATTSSTISPRAEASENAAIDEACIGLIGISNDLKFVDSLEPKVKSTLGEREIKFGPYDANELPRHSRLLRGSLLSRRCVERRRDPTCSSLHCPGARRRSTGTQDP